MISFEASRALANSLLPSDLSSVTVVDMVEVAGSPVTLPCHHGQQQVSQLEWRCRGCFSISNTKESRSVPLESGGHGGGGGGGGVDGVGGGSDY